MKKALSMILALAMILSLGVTAFAEEANTNLNENWNEDVAVGATYAEGATSTPDVYSVHIEWTTNSTLKYTTASTVYNWNAGELKYDDPTTENEAAWTGEATVTVTVTNNSNKTVSATVTDAIASANSATISKADMTWTSQDETQNAPVEYTNGALTVNTAALADHQTNGTAGEIVFTGTLTAANVEGSVSANGAVATVSVTLSK